MGGEDFTLRFRPGDQNWICSSNSPCGRIRHFTFENMKEEITPRMLTEKFWTLAADFFNSALADVYKEREENPFTAAELKKLFVPIPDPVICTRKQNEKVFREQMEKNRSQDESDD